MNSILGVILFILVNLPSTLTAITGCYFSTNNNLGVEICQICENQMFPPPLPNQFQGTNTICSTKLVNPKIIRTVYITNKVNSCRNNLLKDSNTNCIKHPQLKVCACKNYQDVCGGQMDGSLTKPYDNFYEALLIEEKAAKDSFEIDIQFLFINENQGSQYEVLMNEYMADKQCLGTSQYIDEKQPLHFFARKNANITIKPNICTDPTKCYSSTDKITLIIKKFAFHISTFGSITVQNVIINGKDANQEFLKSNCTYQRDLECCIDKDGVLTENDQAYTTKNESDRLGFYAFNLDTCKPIVSFINTQNFPTSAFGTNSPPVIENSIDFRIENNRYQNRQFGLFNIEYNIAGAATAALPLPTVSFKNVEIKNIHILAGIYTESKDGKITNYGFNTIRSIIQVIFTAKVQIEDTTFSKNYLYDGFLSNLIDYNDSFSSFNPLQVQDCTNQNPCSEINIVRSDFTNFNDMKWYIANDSDQQSLTQSTSRSMSPYSILLVGYKGQLTISDSYFQNALPCMSTNYLFCPKFNLMQDYVEHDSLLKLWYPGYSYSLFEYSKTMNSHIILVDFLGKLDVQRNTFFNNTSWGAPAISIRDIIFTSEKPLFNTPFARLKKEIYIYNNDFKGNVGIFYGSAVRIVRKGYDFQENFCGPILFDKNKFIQNFGCRSNFGTVNIHCLFGDKDLIETGIKKEKDIILAKFGETDLINFAQKGVELPTGYNTDYIKTTAMKTQMPHEIIFTNNLFQENMSQWSNAIYILGSQHAKITNNRFIQNGVLHKDLYFLMRNTNYHTFMSSIASSIFYQTIEQGFIADDGTKFLKETSSIFLDLCDTIEIKDNTFQQNWGINTGDSYIGSSINIFRSVSFHGLTLTGNTFSDHTGIPLDVLRQNIASTLQINKHMLSVVSINILSFAQFQNSFDMVIDINKNVFKRNTYYLHPTFVTNQKAKNSKFLSYITSYPEINMISLIKIYYNFDVAGAGPNSSDPQTQLANDLIVNIQQNIFDLNKHLNGLCMIHLIGGEKITFTLNTYTNNDNDYPDSDLNIKQGLQGQICTTDKLGILGKTGKYNSIVVKDMTFTANKGKIITHQSKVSLLSIKNLKLVTNQSTESLVDLITKTNANNPTVLDGVTGSGNTGMTNGVINIMDSQFVSIIGSTFSQNKAVVVNAIAILDSDDIYIKNSYFTTNEYDDKLIKPYLGLKSRGQYFSSPILANSSSVDISNSFFQNNKATHGGALFLSSFSTVTISGGICSDNQVLTGGCFYLQKNSILNTQNVVLEKNIASIAGGSIALFDQSQLVDDSDNKQVPQQSILSDNNAENGGAIYAQTSSITLKYTIIQKNSALITGSGLSLYISSLTAENIKVQENFSQGSASISMVESDVTINGSTFVDNTATSQTYGIKSDRTTLTMNYCEFSQTSINTSELYFINGGYINLSEGTATISHTKFTSGAGYQGGAIYSGFETILNLNDCNFLSNQSLNLGGSIYSFISNQVNIKGCKFSKSTSFLNGSDIFGESSKLIFIMETNFSEITGTSLYGLNLIKLNIFNSTFANEEKSMTRDEIATEARGIQCELCSQIIIEENSYFRFLSAKKGAGLYIDNEYKTYPTSVTIKKSFFFKNKAYQGGGVYLGGNITALVENTLFESNLAYQPTGNIYLERTSGIGGGMVYDCPRINPSCTVLFVDSKFNYNKATMQGGGLQWNDKSYHADSTIEFNGNEAIYGSDRASYAVCVIKVETESDVYPESVCYNKEVNKGREIITRFTVDNVASGQNKENANYFVNKTQVKFISFALVDHLNRRVKSDNYSKLTIIPIAKLTQDDTGWEKIYAQNNEVFAKQGFFSFEKLKLITVPGSIIELSVVTDGIPYRLDRQMMRRNLQSNQTDLTDYQYKDELEQHHDAIMLKNQKARILQDDLEVKKGSTQITQSSDATIQVQIRKCARGEVMRKDYTCYVCPQFKFSLDDTENIILGGTCHDCDNGKSFCTEGYKVAPKQGYWRLDSYKVTFYECPKKGACLGNQDLSFINQNEEDFIGYCREGHQGNLCDSCIDGWAMFQGQNCVSCKNNIIYWVRVAITICIAFIQIVMAIRSTLIQNQQPMKKNAILMKMLLNFVQSVFIFTSFGIQLPSFVSSSMNSTNEVIAAPLQVFNFDCIFKSSIFVDNGIRPYFAQTIVLSLIPIIFSLLAIIYWCLVYYLEYGKEAFVDSFYKREISNKLTVSIIIMLFTILPKIVDLTLRAYKCVNLSDPDSPIYFLKADYDIKCWESTHWYFIVFVAVPSLLIWGIVCPMQLFHFFHEKKEKLFEKEYIEAYGFLLRGYTKRSISNEFVIFYRKMIIIIIGIYVDYSSQTQVLMAFGVLVLSLTYHNSKQPYSDVVFNDLETKSLVCQCIVLISLLYIASTGDKGVQLLFLLVLVCSYIAFIGNAVFFYLKETILDIFQGFYNNVKLYELIKTAADTLKIKILVKVQTIFKEKFLPLDYDHKKEINRMFQYLEQNSNLMDENFAKNDEFINLKRDSRVKQGVKQKLKEIRESKKRIKKLKKFEKKREKHGYHESQKSVNNEQQEHQSVKTKQISQQGIEMERFNQN